MRRVARVAAAAAVCVSSLVPALMRAQARPSAAEIIAKYVTAIGGEAEIRKVTSMKQLATMEVPSMGMSLPVEVYSAAPNKSSLKVTIPGMGEMLQGYNGTVGWDVNPMAGPRLLADKELQQAVDNADFYAIMLYPADRFTSMETVGDTAVDGDKAYIVKMVRKSTGIESRTLFSAKTGLVVGSSTTIIAQGGTIQASQTFGEYKKFGGLLIATKMVQSQGPQTMIMSIQDVMINGAPETAFAVPEQIKPLIKP
jgi:zinc protease